MKSFIKCFEDEFQDEFQDALEEFGNSCYVQGYLDAKSDLEPASENYGKSHDELIKNLEVLSYSLKTSL